MIYNFIKKARKIHGNFFNYSKTNFINSRTKVKIICPIHGEFEQLPLNHLRNKFSCIECFNENRKQKLEIFIKKSKEIHKNRYIYDKVIYINNHTKVCIICPEHGEFWQTPVQHINKKQGCYLCNESFGEKEIEKHLINFNINFVSQKYFEKCKNKKSLPFDFYLPKYNTCIEYDGIQHFKPIKAFGGYIKLKYIKKNDKIKTIFCKNNKIKLIRIKYTKFNNIKDIIGG